MQKEVLSPRSWFLERVAITTAVVALLACAEAPSVGRAYECAGSGACEYQGKRVTFPIPDGEVCAEDADAATTWYAGELARWIHETDCVPDTESFEIECVVGDVCGSL